MRAFSTASGGVMFVPDEIEKKSKKISYSDLVAEDAPKKGLRSLLFGRSKAKKPEKKDLKAA